MAMNRSIVATSIDTEQNSQQKTFTSINPEATNGQMIEFAKAAVALTTNTLTEVSVVDKSNILSGGQKQLVLPSGITFSFNDLKSEKEEDMFWPSYIHDGQTIPTTISQAEMLLVGKPYVINSTAPVNVYIYWKNDTDQYWAVQAAADESLINAQNGFAPNSPFASDGSGTITVAVPSTERFAGFTFDITITA